MDAKKKFAIIANQNVYTDKEVFPLIKDNKIWVGTYSGDMSFRVPVDSEPRTTRYWEDETGQKWRSLGNATWLTNLEHGIRHEELQLMTMEDNLKYNKKLIKKLDEKYDIREYPKYDNYDAIEVPFSTAIPSDYKGIMGVPITFLDKYNPEQFEILGCTQRGCHDAVPDTKKYNDYVEMKQNGKPTGASGNKTNENANIANNDKKRNYFMNADGRIVQSEYSRIFIKHREVNDE